MQNSKSWRKNLRDLQGIRLIKVLDLAVFFIFQYVMYVVCSTWSCAFNVMPGNIRIIFKNQYCYGDLFIGSLTVVSVEDREGSFRMHMEIFGA